MKLKNKIKICAILLAFALSVPVFAEDFSKNKYMSIFYVNDVHGQIAPMYRIINAETQFEALTEHLDNVDAFKFSAGDIMLGSNDEVNSNAGTFLNILNTDATAVGNHEFDMGATKLAKKYSDVKAKKVAANCFIPAQNSLKKQIISSFIVTGKTGEKYGIIGAQSPTLIERMKDKSLFEGIKISGGKQAYSELQKEVNKLEAQGINRIILLSHSGYEEEKEYAKNISGIDVIIGGHSHDLILGLTEGANLQYSPKGEPVVITQAGRDGKNFGILNVEYDKNGVIVKAQNNVYTTSKFNKSMLMTTATNVLLGQSPVVAKVQSTENLTERMNIEENPYTDLFMDMVREETGTDVVLVNSANFRGSLDIGDVTERDISGIFPFKNKMCVVELSEKQLIDALNHGGTSLLAPDLKPSILQISGMTYTLDKSGKVTKAAVYGRKGSMIELNCKNPSSTKFFKVAYDDYLLGGGDAFISLKTNKVIKKYDYDKDGIIVQYLKKHQDIKPLVIKRDGRIKIEK